MYGSSPSTATNAHIQIKGLIDAGSLPKSRIMEAAKITKVKSFNVATVRVACAAAEPLCAFAKAIVSYYDAVVYKKLAGAVSRKERPAKFTGNPFPLPIELPQIDEVVVAPPPSPPPPPEPEPQLLPPPPSQAPAGMASPQDGVTVKRCLSSWGK